MSVSSLRLQLREWFVPPVVIPVALTLLFVVDVIYGYFV